VAYKKHFVSAAIHAGLILALALAAVAIPNMLDDLKASITKANATGGEAGGCI
jgi:hypothetical protein